MMDEYQSTQQHEDSPAVRELAALFAEQARTKPDAVAVRYRGQDVTYRELDRWSDVFAARLLASGCGDLVGVAVARGPLAIAAVLSCIKAGVGHVAIDPTLPVRRQRQLLKRARPSALLLEKSLDRFATVDVPRVWLQPPEETASRELPAWDERRNSDVFHIVFTSGTTGVPKGVCISFHSVLNRLKWMWKDHPFSDDSRLAVHKSLALVASPWENLGGLLKGVVSVILDREDVLDPALFVSMIEGEGLTHLLLTPHLISGLLHEIERRGGIHHVLRLVTSGADSLSPELVRQFHRLLPGVTLLNLYGMSETASNVAAYNTSSLPADATRVPVGRPVANAHISIRDRHLRLLPFGTTGEIYISGPPVALGYLHDEERTNERFSTLADGTVIYRTGDLGRWLPSRDLVVTGRTDNQIKIRGYRVELEEVEQIIAASPYAQEAGICVLNADGDPALAAGVVNPSGVDLQALQGFLRDRLPRFMIPSRVVAIPELPRGANGKLNRTQLVSLIEHHARASSKQTWSPADSHQQQIAAIWTELLGAPPTDEHESFFDAGGHSLLAVRLAGRLESAFDKKVPLRTIFDAPTITGLAIALSS